MTLHRTDLAAALERVPQVSLGTLPTPLVDAPRLAAAMGVGRLLVKRDDLTGLAFGGNKVRQLAFFLGAAVAAGADTVIAGGSYDQSNHARVTAAAARAVGLRSIIVARPGGTHPGAQGNGLLTRLLASEFRVLDALADVPGDRLEEVAHRARVFEGLADEQRAAGHVPYIITGTSVPLGVLGYVAGTLELVDQLAALGIDEATIAVTSAGATQAGVELAMRLLGGPHRVQGLAYLPTDGQGPAWVARLATQASELLGRSLAVDPVSVRNDDRAAGPAYGRMSEGRREAIRLAIETEALLLDPVYTATGLAGLIALARARELGPDDTVVFIHTGGLPALFAYAADLAG
jgi:1-aminocyclopropane-1-carboxylate deaminase/D-cysteine desulfhydrase-like pyridoxal-dependent ACC family enzyme